MDSYTSAVDDLQGGFLRNINLERNGKKPFLVEQFRDEYVEGLRREDLKLKESCKYFCVILMQLC